MVMMMMKKSVLHLQVLGIENCLFKMEKLLIVILTCLPQYKPSLWCFYLFFLINVLYIFAFLTRLIYDLVSHNQQQQRKEDEDEDEDEDEYEDEDDCSFWLDRVAISLVALHYSQGPFLWHMAVALFHFSNMFCILNDDNLFQKVFESGSTICIDHYNKCDRSRALEIVCGVEKFLFWFERATVFGFGNFLFGLEFKGHIFFFVCSNIIYILCSLKRQNVNPGPTDPNYLFWIERAAMLFYIISFNLGRHIPTLTLGASLFALTNGIYAANLLLKFNIIPSRLISGMEKEEVIDMEEEKDEELMMELEQERMLNETKEKLSQIKEELTRDREEIDALKEDKKESEAKKEDLKQELNAVLENSQVDQLYIQSLETQIADLIVERNRETFGDRDNETSDGDYSDYTEEEEEKGIGETCDSDSDSDSEEEDEKGISETFDGDSEEEDEEGLCERLSEALNEFEAWEEDRKSWEAGQEEDKCTIQSITFYDDSKEKEKEEEEENDIEEDGTSRDKYEEEIKKLKAELNILTSISEHDQAVLFSLEHHSLKWFEEKKELEKMLEEAKHDKAKLVAKIAAVESCNLKLMVENNYLASEIQFEREHNAVKIDKLKKDKKDAADMANSYFEFALDFVEKCRILEEERDKLNKYFQDSIQVTQLYQNLLHDLDYSRSSD